MMEARLNDQGKINWEFMEELLFCYLNLNDKKSYKYMVHLWIKSSFCMKIPAEYGDITECSIIGWGTKPK